MFGKVKLECTSNEHRLLCTREIGLFDCWRRWWWGEKFSDFYLLLIWFDDVWNVRDNWMINLLKFISNREFRRFCLVKLPNFGGIGSRKSKELWGPRSWRRLREREKERRDKMTGERTDRKRIEKKTTFMESNKNAGTRAKGTKVNFP